MHVQHYCHGIINLGCLLALIQCVHSLSEGKWSQPPQSSCAKCICIWAHVARHLFSRDELKRSLLFSSKKSEKFTLDPQKMELLLSKLSTEC